MPPQVTAVITTHDRPLCAQEALASLHAETYRDVEIVVVDDGGEFSRHLPPNVSLRIVRGTNLGVGRARNLGLAAARGEFVIFLDDDDVALPHRIATLAYAAQTHHADLCFGLTRRRIEGTSTVLDHVPTHLSHGDIAFCDILTCAPHVNATLVRTEALRAIGGFDADASHFDDWSAWLRLADRDIAMWSIDEVVAEWRIHPRGLSGTVLESRSMKPRILALFERIAAALSHDNAHALLAARDIVVDAEIVTYDDYADVMAAMREELHSAGACFGEAIRDFCCQEIPPFSTSAENRVSRSHRAVGNL